MISKDEGWGRERKNFRNVWVVMYENGSKGDLHPFYSLKPVRKKNVENTVFFPIRLVLMYGKI